MSSLPWLNGKKLIIERLLRVHRARFATVAPVLMILGIALLAGVVIYRYNTSHHLFDIETYAPGEVVFLEGDPGACAYFIHSGEVEVIRQEDGREKVIATLGQNQYFGEMGPDQERAQERYRAGRGGNTGGRAWQKEFPYAAERGAGGKRRHPQGCSEQSHSRAQMIIYKTGE